MIVYVNLATYLLPSYHYFPTYNITTIFSQKGNNHKTTFLKRKKSSAICPKKEIFIGQPINRPIGSEYFDQ